MFFIPPPYLGSFYCMFGRGRKKQLMFVNVFVFVTTICVCCLLLSLACLSVCYDLREAVG